MQTRYMLSVVFGESSQQAYATFDMDDATEALKALRKVAGGVLIEIFDESGLVMRWTEGDWRSRAAGGHPRPTIVFEPMAA